MCANTNMDSNNYQTDNEKTNEMSFELLIHNTQYE